LVLPPDDVNDQAQFEALMPNVTAYVGAYLALHRAKAEASYRQGLISGWRKATRDEGKIEDGVEFLVRTTDRPYDWVGAGDIRRKIVHWW
jgi:hypothetical protein